jgi:hypothetical protein
MLLIVVGVVSGFSAKHSESIMACLVLSILALPLLLIIAFIFGGDWFLELAISSACFGMPGIIISAIADNSNIEEQTGKVQDKSEGIDLVSPYIELTDSQRRYFCNKNIDLCERNGYAKYPIAGLHYRELPISIVGKFSGYAIAEKNNEFDKYAVAIYNASGVHLGFIPAKNMIQHRFIIEKGGRVHAYGYIGCNSDRSLYGEICIEFNANGANPYYGTIK